MLDNLIGARPATGNPRFRQHLVTLDAARWQQLQQQTKAQQLTPAAVLMAAWSETLYVWGAGEDFTLNVTISERRPIHPRAFSTIGPFSIPMFTEIHLDHRHPFTQRVQCLQAQLHQDIDHRYFSGIDVMRELAKTRGLADARMPYTFNCTLGALEGVNGDALTLLGREVYTLSQTPQVLLDAFMFEQQGQLVIRLDGVESAFPASFLAAMAEGFQRMLFSLCQPESWERATFDLLPAEQRQRRDQVNATEAEIPSGLLGDAFVVQARRNPTAVAICTADRQISYGELLNRAAQAAQWLHSQGGRRNELIGLIAARGPEQIIGILAIVLAGACYLPIDAGLPEARRRYMLQDGGVRVVLTNVDAAASLPCFDLRIPAEETAALPARDPAATQDDLAYVLYTSGTTGDPKGVMVTHRNVVNLVADCQRRFRVSPEDRCFAISGFNFDLSVWDIFGALAAGAALVIPDKDAWGDVLVAHLVANGDRPVLAELQQRVAHLLPDYMIPAHLVWHEALPLNRNQKVDRKALSQLPLIADVPEDSGSRQASGDIERTLQALWQDILACDNVGVEQDFFSLGGNSLKALRILTSVRKAFGVAMPLESVYQFNTVQAMAGQIAERGGKL